MDNIKIGRHRERMGYKETDRQIGRQTDRKSDTLIKIDRKTCRRRKRER